MREAPNQETTLEASRIARLGTGSSCSAARATSVALHDATETFDMYRTVLILAACLFLADGAGAAVPETGAAAGPVRAAAGLLLAQPSEVGESEGTNAANPADASGAASEEHSGVVQEIVAGVLTGSLAAVLMLKLLYGRRRKDDPR